MSSSSADPSNRLKTNSGRGWSLTLWLTCFSSLSSFLVLALIALLLYDGLAAHLRAENQYYLHEEAEIVEEMLRTNASKETLGGQFDKDISDNQYIRHFIRLMDRTGRVIMQSTTMEQALPSGTFPLPVRNGRPSLDRPWRTSDGRIFLVASSWVALDAVHDTYGVLEIAQDVTLVEQILAVYRRNVYILLAVGALLCVVQSYLVARRGTRPLREVTEIVRGISAGTLQKRISGEKWPVEVLSMASAMNLMLDRLQDYFDRLYNSARNLSHKMRTPLTIIKGEAEVALSRERTVQELEDVIASGLEENTRLVRLCDNILFLSDAEIGKFGCAPVAIDAGDELEKVVDFYEPIAEEHGITISRLGNATLLADASLFKKAAAALISNAITYNNPGGSVALQLTQGVGLSGELSVADTGCGIADEEKSKVFDRFYRIYGSRHRDPHGTGLGLPIVKAIMDLHKGSVALQSTPGEGTTVTLKFPAPAA